MDELEIKLTLDKTAAEKEAQAFHQAEAKRIAQGKAAAEAAEKSKTATATTEGHKREQAEDKAAAAAKAREREIVNAYVEANREKLAAMAKAHQAQESLNQRGVVGMTALTAAVTASSAGMTALMGAATAAGSAVEETFRQAREQARLASEETTGLQRQLLQMANLRGGGTQEALRAVAAEMSQTGLSFEGAAALRTEAQLGARGFANEKEFAEFVQRSGRLGTISGQSGAEMGRAARIIGDLGGGSLTANEAEIRLLLANELAQRGGISVTDFLEQSKESRDVVASGALTEAQAGGLLALYAARGGGAEEVEQLVAATAGDGRGTIGAALGWSDQIAKAQAQAKAAGRGFSAEAWLADQGVTGEGATALSEFHAARGRWEKDILPVINAAPQPGTIDKRFAEMSRTDPAVRQARVDAAVQFSTLTRGQGASLREQARRMVFEEMKARGETTRNFEDFDKGVGISDFFSADGLSRIWWDETREKVDQRAIGALLDQARASGIDVSPGSRAATLAEEVMSLDPSGGLMAGRRSEPEINRRFDELGSMITARGGDPLAGLNQFVGRFEAAVNRFDQAQRPAGPPPALQGAPRMPPAAAR